MDPSCLQLAKLAENDRRVPNNISAAEEHDGKENLILSKVIFSPQTSKLTGLQYRSKILILLQHREMMTDIDSHGKLDNLPPSHFSLRAFTSFCA